MIRVRHGKIQSHVVDLRAIFSNLFDPLIPMVPLKISNFGHIDHFRPPFLAARWTLGVRIISYFAPNMSPPIPYSGDNHKNSVTGVKL